MGVIFAFCLLERYQWIAHPSHEFDAVNHPCKNSEQAPIEFVRT